MRVLLVQPPLDPMTSRLGALGLAEPLGLEYVAGALPEHDVRLLDLRVEGNLLESVAGFDPELVGVTAVTAGLGRALRLLSQAKHLSSRVKTMIGGVHPTLLPDDCKKDVVDFIVQGDGEHTVAALAQAIDGHGTYDGVPGLVYRENGSWRHNEMRVPGPLDSYPLPARELADGYRQAYHRVGLGQILSAVSSRGCTRRCTFCSVWRFHQGKYRKRSPELIVQELAARPERSIDFVDDDSFSDLRHMARLQQHVAEGLLGRSFKMYVRADAVVKEPDLFERWAAAGLRFVLVGFEAFRDHELDDLNKRTSAQQNVEALKILKKIGIGVIGYVIVRPDYSKDDFEWLADRIESLGIDQPVFGTLTPFPGTTLFEQVEDQLTTRCWDDYDGFHAVLPTELPTREYYHQLAGLYRRAYGKIPVKPDTTPWFETLARAVEGLEPSPGQT